MRDALERQLEAYHRLLPSIIAERGYGWALVANERLVEVFNDFDKAATYAEEHFPHEQVLIRHTSEERATVPFIVASR